MSVCIETFLSVSFKFQTLLLFSLIVFWLKLSKKQYYSLFSQTFMNSIVLLYIICHYTIQTLYVSIIMYKHLVSHVKQNFLKIKRINYLILNHNISILLLLSLYYSFQYFSFSCQSDIEILYKDCSSESLSIRLLYIILRNSKAYIYTIWHYTDKKNHFLA